MKENRHDASGYLIRLPTLKFYERHLEETGGWLIRSIQHGQGGSAAYFSPLLGWSRPYPETTGYIIPTLLDLDQRLSIPEAMRAALSSGEWLLKIQRAEGAWNQGLHPPRRPRASVFNTGQILKGMIALYRRTGDARWLDAGHRGAQWLASGVGTDGLWTHVDYQAARTPSYYTEVLWPMLEIAQMRDDISLAQAARRALDSIVARLLPNGVIKGWSFREGKPAFTHTIGYTLWGIMECARLLDEWMRYAPAIEQTLEHLVRRSELAGGRLPGAFAENWKADSSFVCLTGNAQVAQCVLAYEAKKPDLRLVSAAARMLDYVCSRQRLTSILSPVRGAVPGSAPFWGGYMRTRYPNWAAKYHCDALMALIDRVTIELSDLK